MAVLQVDHTPVDLLVVDETWRKPVGRPWLTLAIDVHSRCITGLHLSFEGPIRKCVVFTPRLLVRRWSAPGFSCFEG